MGSTLETSFLSFSPQTTLPSTNLLETATLELPDYQPNLDLSQEKNLIVQRQKGQLRLCLKHLSTQKISSDTLFNSQLSSLQEQKATFETFTANFSSSIPMATNLRHSLTTDKKVSFFDTASSHVKSIASEKLDEVKDFFSATTSFMDKVLSQDEAFSLNEYYYCDECDCSFDEETAVWDKCLNQVDEALDVVKSEVHKAFDKALGLKPYENRYNIDNNLISDMAIPFPVDE
ncbi:MAG: hypothetical protein BGO10_06610 [Chlamydia sp. 32-24]|nr:MAG: hypothetical protein BGO10_06610 [Chlamydia sp. 32-24]